MFSLITLMVCGRFIRVDDLDIQYKCNVKRHRSMETGAEPFEIICISTITNFYFPTRLSVIYYNNNDEKMTCCKF